jgi:hypothetical protein
MDEMEDDRTTSQSLSILNMLFGAWLIVTPYVFSYTVLTQVRWQQTIAGIVILLLAGMRFAVPQIQWASWVNVFVGIWLVVAAFAMGYQSTAAFWNDLIFGILVAISEVWNASIHTTAPLQHHQG